MYRCLNCKQIFEYRDYIDVCLEDYYGVGNQFSNRNYGTIAVCPYCGSEDMSLIEEDREVNFIYEED